MNRKSVMSRGFDIGIIPNQGRELLHCGTDFWSLHDSIVMKHKVCVTLLTKNLAEIRLL